MHLWQSNILFVQLECRLNAGVDAAHSACPIRDLVDPAHSKLAAHPVTQSAQPMRVSPDVQLVLARLEGGGLLIVAFWKSS